MCGGLYCDHFVMANSSHVLRTTHAASCLRQTAFTEWFTANKRCKMHAIRTATNWSKLFRCHIFGGYWSISVYFRRWLCVPSSCRSVAGATHFWLFVMPLITNCPGFIKPTELYLLIYRFVAQHCQVTESVAGVGALRGRVRERERDNTLVCDSEQKRFIRFTSV